MSAPIDELHGLVNDLEDEGHSLAGRFRDLLDNLKADFSHLLGGGKNELDVFVKSLVSTLVPELDNVKAQVVAEVIAELHKVTDEVKAVVSAVHPAAPAAPVEPAAPAAPAVDAAAPAPAPVEPSATAAPAQG